jgi:hypothetical protein
MNALPSVQPHLAAVCAELSPTVGGTLKTKVVTAGLRDVRALDVAQAARSLRNNLGQPLPPRATVGPLCADKWEGDT